MKKSRRRTALGTLTWILILFSAGCQSAQEPSATADKAAVERDERAEEAHGVAEASLGKLSEILAQGDLALNGREQLLVVNRIAAAEPKREQRTNASPVLVRRAAILEKNDGKWSQILLCDEHLKNTNGYLGGLPKARMEGWRLAFSESATQGLAMSFTPMNHLGVENATTGDAPDDGQPTFFVRWNKDLKRYQSFDKSHERYLGEVPSLEAPESILK